MPYIIENANILKGDQLSTNSLLIEQNRILQLKRSFHMNHVRMDASPFIMTRPHVMFAENIPLPSKQGTEYYTHEFILKGCTTFVTYVSLTYEEEFFSKLAKRRNQLAASPIDFVVGVKIPLRLLTTSLIRKCKREKVPMILIKVENKEELLEKPWGWLREAMFPYFPLLIPVFAEENPQSREEKEALWDKIMSREKIRAISVDLQHGSLVPDIVQREMGLYPLKGNLHPGGEVSYNLYIPKDVTKIVDESALFHYDNSRLLFTIHKGMVIRAGKKINYRPSFGNEVEIKTTGYFTTPFSFTNEPARL